MSPDAMFNFHNGLIVLVYGFSLIVAFGWAQQSNNKPEEFNCPEEFGYYPHPTDCAQYYVCVFGGALLESCTGGLMYSHDLQTCDWPRNVGCGTSSLPSSSNNAHVGVANEALNGRQTSPWKLEALRSQQEHEISDRHLYEQQDIGGIEEIESDRQQRVYRGQPFTLGQVARDRDGIIRHDNALQTQSGPEKVKTVAIISFSPHQQSLRPSSPVPSYIIEQSVSPVASTTKMIYNSTRFDPYYNVYDEDPEAYHDSDYSQYQNRRKIPSSYQIVQKTHYRPQPEQSQIVNNTGSYTTNQDYILQSNIDEHGQQSEKSGSTRLFSDDTHLEIVSKATRNWFSVHNNPNNHRIINLPVVDTPETNNENPHLKIMSSFSVSKDTFNDNNSNVAKENNIYRRPSSPTLEITRSHELTSLDSDEPPVGETLHQANVTPYPFGVAQNVSASNNVKSTIKASKITTTTTTTSRPAPKMRPSLSDIDSFRINVPPISMHSKSALSTKRTTPAFTPLDHKFSYRSQSTNFTYTPYAMISTTAKPIIPGSSFTNNIDKQKRFYVPRTNAAERKLHFTQTSTSPTLQSGDKSPPFKTIKPILTSSNSTRPYIPAVDDGVRRNSKSVTVTPPPFVTSTSSKTYSNDAHKLYEDNEILYYDDYYYGDGDGDEDDDEDDNDNDNDDGEDVKMVDDNGKNNHNYIDNKISEYTTTMPKTKSTKLTIKTITQTRTTAPAITSSTAVNTPKSSPSRKIASKYADQSGAKEADIVDSKQRLKESNIRNEKPFVVRGRMRGSVTYTTGGNEYDSVTAEVAGGRIRPTLKPSTSIIGKSLEVVDIYRHPPKRPDPVYPTPQADKAAAKCRKDICLLPDCSCGGKDIPGDLSVEETPQIVLLTFDDSVNELNKGIYEDLFEKGRINPNGCPISATFYVSHEWTEYSMVQNLYAAGHEIASHSVSHSFGEQFSQRKWTKEIVGQREILSAYGGVRQEDIRGMRAPFLAVGGNKMFKMLYDANFTYDSSMPIYENKPPSWPYTMDYKLFHECMIPPCPTRSYPGVWEMPMVMWQDLNGGRCSMGDACSNPSTSDGIYKMLIKNFERHFTTNRAPFGLYYHSSWFTQPHHKDGFTTFLDTIVHMPEVWLITNWQAIQWARDPTPISRLNQFTPFGCDYPERPRRCNNPKVCNLWHKSGVRYLKTCQPCPDVYPWTGKTGVRNSRVDNDDSLTE